MYIVDTGHASVTKDIHFKHHAWQTIKTEKYIVFCYCIHCWRKIGYEKHPTVEKKNDRSVTGKQVSHSNLSLLQCDASEIDGWKHIYKHTIHSFWNRK